jgi:transposase
MIQLAWRFLLFQKDSALALWYRARTADSRLGTRKTMIVAPCLRRGKLWHAS